jgi:hypothetical protein
LLVPSINNELGVIVVSVRGEQSDDIARSILAVCGCNGMCLNSIFVFHVLKINKERLDWPTFEATFKAAMVHYRKYAGQHAKAIVVVEDIHSTLVQYWNKPDFSSLFIYLCS